MRCSLSAAWKDLPDKLTRLSVNIRETIESDNYLSDEDNLQFQISTKEIIAFKNDLHEGVVFQVFFEAQSHREILSRYLQHQLNAVENLKKDFMIFLKTHSIASPSFGNDVLTPPGSPNRESQQTSMNLLSPTNAPEPVENPKKLLLDQIRFFIAKIAINRECYKELYAKRDGVKQFIEQKLLPVEHQLPQTTYTLERLCEVIDEKQAAKLDAFDEFKRRYNKIKSYPIVQYTAKLYKMVRELKTRTFAFSKCIAVFEKHLKDQKNVSNTKELIERLEQNQHDIRYFQRNCSLPIEHFTDKTQPVSSPSPVHHCMNYCQSAARSRIHNQNSEFSFELVASEYTNDQSSVSSCACAHEDPTSSFFQSKLSLGGSDFNNNLPGSLCHTQSQQTRQSMNIKKQKKKKQPKEEEQKDMQSQPSDRCLKLRNLSPQSNASASSRWATREGVHKNCEQKHQTNNCCQAGAAIRPIELPSNEHETLKKSLTDDDKCIASCNIF